MKTRLRTHLTISLVLLSACELGRPIVGELVPPDDEEGRMCVVGFECEAVRSLGDAYFDVPPFPARMDDCDADFVEDSIDTCPGIPNPIQTDSELCAAARMACAALEAGELQQNHADLRGCVTETPIELTGDLHLESADLSCAHIAVQNTGTDARAVFVGSATATGTTLVIDAGAPTILDAGRARFVASTIELKGNATLLGDGSIFERTFIRIDPVASIVATPDGAGPAVDIVESDIRDAVFVEPSSSRSGRIRIDDSSITQSAFEVRGLDLLGTRVVSTRISARELSVVDAELFTSALRADFTVIASSTLNDIVFDRCVELRLINTEAQNIDVPLCGPGRFRVSADSEIMGSRLSGGLDMSDSRLAATSVGAGDESTFRANEVDVDGVQFCDLGAAAFIGGDIRCTACEVGDFMGGASVCVSGSRLIERGCQAIEFAAECD